MVFVVHQLVVGPGWHTGHGFGTGALMAGLGAALEQPLFGCIAVLSRDDPTGWKGHVGFFLRTDAQSIFLLGGNQLDQVCEHYYPKATVLAYRWPKST